MKRISEKVKDVVEVCPFTHLHDFQADPLLTLAGYHFTDITADLMAKWIDRIVSVRPGEGIASALAGFRGVGKSHFMAVLAAIVARPELRSRISDKHVESRAERLSRRHGPVAFVRRGAGTSLLDELKRAVAEILSVNPGTLSDSLYDLLLRASEHAGDLPLVLLIDTAMGRDARVARDDGVLLSEIADAAKTLGIFVGVALDDDISGADGANLAITSSFVIDYLDQEHLYKIVDTHIFSKHSQMLPLLHDIYEGYREVLPGFRWSEQRFSSLYPLHPATLEIAPLIRLYIQDFALLGFAAEAGVKILGRPANSLIGLDEIFDGVESRLRLVEDLKDAFAAFDTLEHEVIAKTPVQSRLPAKLILKGLLMLSLDGQGTSAAEIAAAMMIFNDNVPGATVLNIPELLDSFAAALPRSIERVEKENADAKYCFKLAGKQDVNDILAESLSSVSDDILWESLKRVTSEKFSEVELSTEASTTNCTIEWRGAIHRGEIVWSGDTAKQAQNADWTVVVQQTVTENMFQPTQASNGVLVWKIADLTDEERDTIRRHHLLTTDTEVREKLGDGVSTAIHVTSIAVDKLWQRVFLLDSLLIAGDSEFKFGEDANSSHSLSQLFSGVLAPYFGSQYPEHPEFPTPLTMKAATHLIANFFSASGSGNADSQKLAAELAAPLGLAFKQGDEYVPVQSEGLIELPVVKAAFDASTPDDRGIISIDEISKQFKAAPNGLTREARQLILAALVAQRQYEFVTSSGNRINHRSLDLQIIWDDIVGVAKPLNEFYAPERLLAWAKLITGNAGLRSLDRSEDRLLIIDSLSGWISGWKDSRILDDFNALPDEALNAGIWRTAANLQKSFGAMAETIDLLVRNEITLDQCLHSVADLFSDSEADFEKKKSDLRVLQEFTKGVSRLNEITGYLSLCEMTGDAEIEALRQELLDMTGTGNFVSATNGKETFDLIWTNFKDLYADYYAERHDAVMVTASGADSLREMLRSDSWAVFESFSKVPWFDQRYISRATSLIREIRQSHCGAKVRDVLASKPFCTCTFNLAEAERLAELPGQLKMTVDSGLGSFMTRFIENIDSLSGMAGTDAMSASIRQILESVKDLDDFAKLPTRDIRILKIAAERHSELGAIAGETRKSSNEDLAELLPADTSSLGQEVERLEIFANH